MLQCESESSARADVVPGSAVFDALADPVFALERDGRIAYLNAAARVLLGHTPEPTLGRPLSSVLAELDSGEAELPLTLPALERAMSQVAASGERQRLRLLHPKGRLLEHEIFLADGRVWSLARDVTAERELAQQADDARRELLTITDALPVLVCLVDAEYRYRFVNAMYERWFGQRREDLIGKTLEQVLGSEAFRAVAPHINAALAGERVVFEMRVPYATVGDRHIRSTNTPYYVDGKVAGYIALVQDITPEKRHEAELNAAIATRDEFLSIASHELRTPLTSLDLQLDGLMRAVERGAIEPERLARKVAIAVRQADRLGVLIDGLLNVSRLDHERFRLELDSCDLAELVREVTQRFEERAARAGSALQIRAELPAPGVWDRSRLDQVISNLLSNAVKYGAGRPIEVSLGAFEDRVEVNVRDQGIGIAPEDRERVLGRFERAVSSRHYGGLGLGLYIAREIARAHGGAIEVESELGVGSRFTLRLPWRTQTGDA